MDVWEQTFVCNQTQLHLEIALPNYLSLFRPSVCGNARHFLKEGFVLPLESLYGSRASEPPVSLHIHLLSCFRLGGQLQIPAVCVHSEQLEDLRLWQIHPDLQSLVSW